MKYIMFSAYKLEATGEMELSPVWHLNNLQEATLKIVKTYLLHLKDTDALEKALEDTNTLKETGKLKITLGGKITRIERIEL